LGFLRKNGHIKEEWAMALRQNCWEWKKCGRQSGGEKADELGVCPAATENAGDGLNRGTKAGRICWAISGTFCSGKIQGTFAEKQLSCMTCDFFKKVKEEEGTANFMLLLPEQKYTPHK
jgi:hypothetical protein